MVDHIEPDEPQSADDAARRAAGREPPTDPEPATPSGRDEQEGGSWLDEAYPLVDADFVGSTLDRVLNDRDEIESEAACVEQFRFPAEFIERYTSPEARHGFVEDTLARVLAERAAGRTLRTDEDYEFYALIEQAQVPEPGADFVSRTLRAVLQDGGSIVQTTRPAWFARPFSLVAAVAAIVLCAFAFFWRTDTPPTEITPFAAPIAWGSLVRDADESDQDFAIRLAPRDPIVAFLDDARAVDAQEGDK